MELLLRVQSGEAVDIIVRYFGVFAYVTKGGPRLLTPTGDITCLIGLDGRLMTRRRVEVFGKEFKQILEFCNSGAGMRGGAITAIYYSTSVLAQFIGFNLYQPSLSVYSSG